MSSGALDPETLARIAAQLNPQLACDDPAKAIELARKLVIAADPELAEQEAQRAEEIRLDKESERYDQLFPRGELISVAEAFRALPGAYKTESGFAAALRKAKLTTADEEGNFVQGHEFTSLRAVDELFRRQNKAKKARDRDRKAASNKKNKKNVAEFQSQKAERIRRKAEPENKKRKQQSKKRKPQKARQSH